MRTIGASELAAVIGAGRTRQDGEPYTSPMAVWARCCELVERYETASSPDAEVGQILEPGLLLAFALHSRLTPGLAVTTGALPASRGLEHPDIPWLHAHPDGYVFQKDPVELKAPRDLDPEWWGENGTADVPAYYLVQVVAQLALAHRVLGATRGYLFAVARAPRRSRVIGSFTVERDPELEGRVLEAGERWYRDHVVAGTPPPPDGSDSYSETLDRMFRANTDIVAEARPEQTEAVRRLLQRKTRVKEALKGVAEVSQDLKLSMGPATVLNDAEGRKLATYRTGKDGRRRLRLYRRDGTFEEDE